MHIPAQECENRDSRSIINPLAALRPILTWRAGQGMNNQLNIAMPSADVRLDKGPGGSCACVQANNSALSRLVISEWW